MVTYADFRPSRRFGPTLALSPDGSLVAYVDDACGQFNLVVQPVDGSPARRLTRYTDSTVREAVWTPDGRHLIFAIDTHGDEFYQIRRVPAAGGPIEALTDASGVQHELGEVSPDGRWLSYAGNDRDRSVQDLLIRDQTTGGVHRVPGAGGYMFPGPWAPDSSRFSAIDWRTGMDHLVYVAPLDGKARCLRPPTGPAAKCALGPWYKDGILVLTDEGREFTGLARMDAHDGTLDWIVTPEWDVEHVALSRDERILVWTVNVGGTSELHVDDLGTGEHLEVPQIPAGTIHRISLSADGTRLALRLSTGARPSNVAIARLDTGRFEWLTDAAPVGAAVGAAVGVEPTLVSFPTFDGRQIPAWLYRPTGDGPFGVAMSIHGGPEFQERPAYNLSGLYQYLISQGVAVLAPNVRGSTGYGRAYQKLIHHDFGGGDLRDFEAAAQYLRQLSWVDPDRIGVFGGSYGGFATLSCLSRLPRYWACGVSRFGLSNLVAFARSAPPTWHAMMATVVGDPDTEADFLLSRSPITYADNIRAPLFVIQGANDPRVVRGESDQIVARLGERGVDVRYDVYDDEGHGFTKAHNEAKAMADTADFLIAHLRHRQCRDDDPGDQQRPQPRV
jgi:dipeptidyl aminopeptidase/acylaminoacyl peptidase